MRYVVQVSREGDWWVIEFDGIDGRIHSQAKRLDQVPERAAEALTMWFEDEDGRKVSPDDIDVVPQLGDELGATVEQVREVRAALDNAQRAARAAMEQAIEAGERAGLPQRDVGELLGVSHQYVAKVAKARDVTRRPQRSGPRRSPGATVQASGSRRGRDGGRTGRGGHGPEA